MADYQRLTDRARKVLKISEDVARRCGARSIRLEHVLIALAEESEGVAGNILRWLGASAERIAQLIPTQKSPFLAESEPVNESEEIAPMVSEAYRVARSMDHNYIGTEHLVIAVVMSENLPVQAVLIQLNLSPRTVRDEVYSLLGHAPPSDSPA